MKFVGLLSLVCVFCLAVTLFSPVESGKIKKLKIAKKVGKLLLLRGVTRPRVALVALPLPVPIPIIRKTVHSPITSDSWGSSAPHSTTSYEIPSLSSLPESILNLLRPALSTIAASALRSNNQAWGVSNSLPLEASWPSSIESSWPPAAPVQHSAWGAGPAAASISGQQQQEEVVEQQQTNNYA